MEWIKWRNWAARNSSWLWALLLLAVGAYLVYRWPASGFRHALGEFSLLAGGLTVTVDPYLKRKLQREAAEDIFHHLLGLDLPIEIRDTLRDFLLSNRLYRRNMVISCDINPLTEGREVELKVAVRAEVVSAANAVYEQHISFGEAEKGAIVEASVTSTSHPEKSYTVAHPYANPVPDEPMVYGWTGNKIELKKDEHLGTFIEFKVQKPIRDFWIINFGISTIHPTVRISGHESLTVTASKADQVNGNDHIYRKVFVAGDHIQVRWKPKELN